ncbi:XRE family transcriptional regulator [Streptomyces sp. NPDC057654]|uniref:XRE family transcriptional regulator n=1 Tax=Streptomyces sp. NPDC057654 TaxID=3346196 RepID=UPI0036C7D11E
MTPAFHVPHQPDGQRPTRRGRKPDAIGPEVGVSHRAWLEPIRARLTARSLTLDDLVARSGYSKTRISELLRGKGYYPGWEITYSVVRVLDVPIWPLRLLWTAGAREAGRGTEWIERQISAVPAARREDPPLAHEGFTEGMRRPYTAYAAAFLQRGNRAQWVVREVFDILWLGWEEAVSSPDVRRHAWCLLRDRVLLRAERRRDGCPDLVPAAFSTVTQSKIIELSARFAQIAETAGLFAAVSRLPPDQLDVIVLRYLCGQSEDAAATIAGLPPAITHAIDQHARDTLNCIYHPDTPDIPDLGVTAPQ